jgi:ubiquinone/menaquinone biosynthesis C-methylase UbiE
MKEQEFRNYPHRPDRDRPHHPVQEPQLDGLRRVYQQRAPMLGEINQVAPWHAIYRRRTLELLWPFLTPATRVLDLASGTGIFAHQIADKVKTLTLLDALPLMLDLSRATFAATGLLDNGPEVRFVQHDIESNDTVTLGPHDLILLTQAMNFISQPHKLFAFVERHLSPTGMFHFDIDTAFRWSVIEALSGRVGNALEIALKGQDSERMIVGTDYFFYGREAIMHSLSQAGLAVQNVRGLCYVSPFLHVFNVSADFLNPDHLNPSAAPFLDAANLNTLQQLDEAFESTLPPEAAGWMAFQVRRKST